MKRSIYPILWLFLCLGAALQAAETAEKTPGVYVILDGSGSMWGQLPDGTNKIVAARSVLKRFVAESYEGREMAFRVYGHRREGDCSDSELVVPFSAPNQAIPRMAAFADGVNPKGKTPISRSLRAALEDFGDRPGEIVLISDGIETCDEDPCALVRAWQEKNVAVRVHVVGLGLQDKERAAMQCISEAAGTEYQDAQSTDELALGLEKIQQTASKPPPQRQHTALVIAGALESGERMRVAGTATQAGQEPIRVSSDSANPVPPGEYQVTIGVRTWNGNIYAPVTQTVTVPEHEIVTANFIVPEPPSMKSRFVQRGEEVNGALIYGYQDGERTVTVRAQDRAYLDPGTYEFRSKPNADNELSITETFTDGDHKEIVFELTHTVHALISMVSAGSNIAFYSNYELWQDGEKKYDVHRGGGVRAVPGTYDLRLPLRLTPYTYPGLVLTEEDKQEFRIEVPVGHVTVIYQNADGSRAKDERCFLERRVGENQYQRDRITPTGQRIPLVEGTYQVHGWKQLGNYDPVSFDIAVGDEKEIILRDKGDG